MPILDLQESALNDYAMCYWDGANWNIETDGVAAEVGYEDAVRSKLGYRTMFRNVTIPKGAIITSSYISVFSLMNTAWFTVNSKIIGNLEVNPPQVLTIANYQVRRGTSVGGPDDSLRTVSEVLWDNVVEFVTNTWYDSPDISPVIQELVNQALWASGGIIALFWDDHEARGTQAGLKLRVPATWGWATHTDGMKLHLEWFVNAGNIPLQIRKVGPH